VASAVGKDKARYIGGTPEDFPLNTPAAIFGNAPKIEGRLDTRAASAFTFDGGQWGTLSIPYEAITYVEYGRKLHRPEFTFAYGAFPLDRLPLRAPDGRHRIWIPWDPFDRYTDKVHYMLTLVQPWPVRLSNGPLAQSSRSAVTGSSRAARRAGR
jgi:hypothetical protein